MEGGAVRADPLGGGVQSEAIEVDEREGLGLLTRERGQEGGEADGEGGARSEARLGGRCRERARGLGAAAGGGPVLLGILWALLPCGLLYSALLVATMASSALEGALVMACFAAGSGFTLVVGPWLWLRWRGSRPFPFDGSWGVRLAGIALAGSSTWALWMAFAHNQAPWCVTL